MLTQGRPLPAFRIYRTAGTARTYMVVSVSASKRGADRLAPRSQFVEDRALESLVADLRATARRTRDGPVSALTLMVHGFNTRRGHFERSVLADADPERNCDPAVKRRQPPGASLADESFRPEGRVYVGFRWPSEGMFAKRSLWDSLLAVVTSPAIGTAMLAVPLAVLLLFGRGLGLRNWLVGAWRGLAEAWWAAVSSGHPLEFLHRILGPGAAPYWGLGLCTLLLGAALVLLALRVSTYLRDQYRALHYGVADLGEFLRALEDAVNGRAPGDAGTGARAEDEHLELRLDVIGHSMGALLLINALRIMSDYFYDPEKHDFDVIGYSRTYRLRTLILCSPDVPLAMATPDHNNYFLSALRRFGSAHLFSNDRDVILKWLSAVANWIAEPRYDLAGRRLGNVLLVRNRIGSLGQRDSRRDWTLWPVTRPVFRHFDMFPEDPVGQARPAVLDIHDCTRDVRLSGSDAAVLLLGVVLTLIGEWLLVPSHSGLGVALGAWLAIVFVLGPLARLVWPWARDVAYLRGAIGWCADLPSLLAFLGPLGSNPHGGYFHFGGEARRQIAALLRSEGAAASVQPGEPALEADGRIRWKRVYISV